MKQKHASLQMIRRLRHDSRPIIYTCDEICVIHINAHHTKERMSVDSEGQGQWKVPSRKGQRLIVVHASGVDGQVSGNDVYMCLC